MVILFLHTNCDPGLYHALEDKQKTPQHQHGQKRGMIQVFYHVRIYVHVQ